MSELINQYKSNTFDNWYLDKHIALPLKAVLYFCTLLNYVVTTFDDGHGYESRRSPKEQ